MTAFENNFDESERATSVLEARCSWRARLTKVTSCIQLPAKARRRALSRCDPCHLFTYFRPSVWCLVASRESTRAFLVDFSPLLVLLLLYLYSIDPLILLLDCWSLLNYYDTT